MGNDSQTTPVSSVDFSMGAPIYTLHDIHCKGHRVGYIRKFPGFYVTLYLDFHSVESEFSRSGGPFDSIDECVQWFVDAHQKELEYVLWAYDNRIGGRWTARNLGYDEAMTRDFFSPEDARKLLAFTED